MEKRRLIAVAVEGPTPSEPPAPWVSLGDGRGALLFGLERRHEEDAEEALRWASAHSATGQRVVVKRIAVEIDSEGPKINWDRELSTDFLSTPEGEVWVDASIARIYERRYLFEKVGDGAAEVFYLRGARRYPERIRGVRPEHAPLIARRKELSLLEEFREQAEVDQGQIVGLVGEPGIGKTRLLAAWKETLGRQKARFLEGSFTPRVGISYEGFRPIVAALAEGNEEARKNPFLRLLLDPGKRIEELERLSAEELKTALFFAVRKTIHEAARTPIVLLIEDLHWADDLSQSLLAHVLEGLEETKALVVVSHRPDVTPAWGKRLNYNEIRLAPLVEKESTAFLKAIAGADRTAERLTRELYRLSLGNPLYLEEIFRQLQERKAIEVETDEEGGKLLRLRATARLDLPHTIEALITSRLDLLPAESRDLLSWASLFGSSADAEELEDLLSADFSPSVPVVLADLVERGYLRERSAFPQRVYQFAHDLVFETVRESLPARERKRRHTRIATFLEDRFRDSPTEVIGRVAQHHLQGEDDGAALRSAAAAGKHALATHQYERAVSFLREALKRKDKEGVKSGDPGELFEPYITALLDVAQLDRAREALEKWAPTGKGKAAYARMRMKYHQARSEVGAAWKWAEAFASAIEKEEVPEEILHEAGIDRVHLLLSLGRSGDALHEARMALRELGPKGEAVTRLRLSTMAVYCTVLSGDPELSLDPSLVLRYLETTRPLLSESFSPVIQIEHRLQIASILEAVQLYTDAVAALTEAIGIAEASGLRQHHTRLLLQRGWNHLELARYDRALADFETALGQAHLLKQRALGATALLGTTETLLQIGAVDDAETLALRSDHPSVRNADPSLRARVLWTEGKIAQRKGDLAKAIEKLTKTVEIFASAGDQLSETSARLHLLRLRALEKPEAIPRLQKELARLRKEPSSAALRGELALTALALQTEGPELSAADLPRASVRLEFLREMGRRGDVSSLKAYRKERVRLLEHVPETFRRGFEKVSEL